VEDFGVTNYQYAKKYFLKAKPIWTAFAARIGEFNLHLHHHLSAAIELWEERAKVILNA